MATYLDCLHPFYDEHPRNETVTSLAFCCCNDRVVSASTTSIRMWISQTGETLWAHTPPDNQQFYASRVAVSPNGELIAYYTNWRVHSPTSDTQMHIQATNGHTLSGGAESWICEVSSHPILLETFLCFSPDGTKLLYSTNKSDLCLWDSCSGASHVMIDCTESAISQRPGRSAFSLDSTRLIIGNATGIHVWDVTSGEPMRPIQVISSAAGTARDGIGFTSSGRAIVSIAGRGPSVVRVWDVATGSLLKEGTSYHRTLPSITSQWQAPNLMISDDLVQISVVIKGQFLVKWALDADDPYVSPGDAFISCSMLMKITLSLRKSRKRASLTQHRDSLTMRYTINLRETAG